MISFKDIKAIGFDLDNTLYENNPEIDRRIKIEIAKKILEKKSELKTIENALKLCESIYSKIGSRTDTLKNLGYLNAEEIMSECMSKANFTDLLERDEALLSLISKIKKRYMTFLITGTPFYLALPRLEKLGLDLSYFSHTIFGDTLNAGQKINGSIYRFFLSFSPYSANKHIYVGDNLKADIIPAKSAGMRTIAVGNKIPEADFSIAKIYDLESLLF